MKILCSLKAIIVTGLFVFAPLQTATAGNANCKVVTAMQPAQFQALVNRELANGNREVVGSSLTSGKSGMLYYALICDA